MAQAHIGTSGWNYNHWKGLFYPEGVSRKKWLPYFAEHFDTAEVNYSFYHLPRVTTYENWSELTPDNFQFALKLSRIITHNKRLDSLGDLWENFIGNATTLGGKLGPILVQLPPSFHVDADRLKQFLKYAKRTTPDGLDVRFAFEFRHDSWFTKEVSRILEKANASLVIADSSRYPGASELTTDFAYFRYHGPTRLFASNYSTSQLEKEAAKMQKLMDSGTDVYAYFNNDGFGFAVKNAAELKKLLAKPKRRKAG